MFGMPLTVIRVEVTQDGALGVLRIGERVFCWTLQPDPTDEHFFIPAGLHQYRRYHSTNYPDTFEIIVPGHTALLFHNGNNEDHTEGCLLLGSDIGFGKDGRRWVCKSRFTFQAFMGRMRDVSGGTINFIDSWKG